MILHAIDSALAFLLSKQDADGAWRDFMLPPGQAEAWTTAYVGRCVRQAAPDRQSALNRAGAFLHAQASDRGWGYNHACPPDADTTAHVLLFLPGALAKHGAALARYCQTGGGVRTYTWPPRGHGWGEMHPEVTTTVMRALLRWLAPDHVLIRRGITWLSTQHNAYWWNAPHYLPLEKLRLHLLAPETRRGPLPQASDGTAFDMALALESVVLSGQPAQNRALELLALQRSDGSWPSAPILRLPNPAGDKSTRYADVRRLFTTATVLSSLVQFTRAAGV
jgi:hypothetical protein